MKIVLTGCTGTVGRELVPQLILAGAELLLVGRDPEHIRAIFPGIESASYDEISKKGFGYDLIAHLATLNNNAGLPLEEFYRINVDHALYVFETAKLAQIKRIVYFSSFHALDGNNNSAYAASKREAEKRFGQSGINAVILYLPMVYGRQWYGKLSILNGLPKIVSTSIFYVVAAFKPVVRSRKISDFLMAGAPSSEFNRSFLYDDKSENVVYGVTKRLLDLVFAFSITVVFWWLLTGIWFAIRVQSRGPGVFAQVRIGEHGKSFVCFKFRTMVAETKQSGTREISSSSVTALGRILRHAKLDELPQILNIFRNEMTLVGPRPCLPVQDDLINKRKESGVFSVKPGITGYAQINNIDMSDPALLNEYDMRYKAMRSILLDTKILLCTFLGGGRGDRVGRS